MLCGSELWREFPPFLACGVAINILTFRRGLKGGAVAQGLGVFL